MLSSAKIISFTAIATTDTTITYIGQRGKLKTRRVLETVAAINTACISNAINMMIPVTLDTGIVLYLNIDRVIYVDSLSASSPLLTAVTYDAGVNSPVIYKCSLPTPANFNSVTDNTFGITTQSTSSIPSRTRYINSERIASISSEAVGTDAILQLLMRPESYTVTAAGSGFTALPIVSITGGGGTGATATSTAKIISGVVAAPGTGYVQADTITIAGGTSTTASIFNVATTQVVTVATNAAGTGYVPGDTIVLAGGTSSIAAVATVATTKVVTAIVVAGGASGTPGAVTITGTTGTGTKFQATGTINGVGALAGALVVTIAGDYTINPTNIAVEPVTGGSLVGATVILEMGVLANTITTPGSYTVNTASFTQTSTSGVGVGATFNTAVYGVLGLTVNTAGSYTVIPANPAAQGATSGAGVNATITGNWGVNTIVLGANGSGYSSMPTVTITGGTGATGVAVMEGDSISVTDGGSGYTTTPLVSFTGGGGTLLAATATLDLATETVTGGTVTVRGGGYTSFPTLVLTGGLGAFVLYDQLGPEFVKLQVAETIVQLQTAINAL